jgi:hypothetical protein
VITRACVLLCYSYKLPHSDWGAKRNGSVSTWEQPWGLKSVLGAEAAPQGKVVSVAFREGGSRAGPLPSRPASSAHRMHRRQYCRRRRYQSSPGLKAEKFAFSIGSDYVVSSSAILLAGRASLPGTGHPPRHPNVRISRLSRRLLQPSNWAGPFLQVPATRPRDFFCSCPS